VSRTRRIRDKRDRVGQLQVFCTAARLQSLTRTAERLGRTPAAVSLRIRELEHELGAVLLERGPAGTTLTPAGERLRALAEPVVDGVDALFGNFRQALEDAGEDTVRLLVEVDTGLSVLAHHARRFRERCPAAVLRLASAPFDSGLQRLCDESADLLLATERSYPHERFRYRELLRFDRVLIAPLGHPLAARERVAAHEAAAYRFVVPTRDSWSRQVGERMTRQWDIEVDIAVEVSNWDTVKRYVEAGAGVSVVPRIVLSDTDRLAVIALDAEVPTLGYGVFALRDTPLAPPARRFLQGLVAHGAPPGPAGASRARDPDDGRSR